VGDRATKRRMGWCDWVCARAGARSGAATAGLRKGRVLWWAGGCTRSDGRAGRGSAVNGCATGQGRSRTDGDRRVD
jgi:hypothetical protein